MRVLTFSMSCIAIAWLLAGCSVGEASLVGEWSGTISPSAEAVTGARPSRGAQRRGIEISEGAMRDLILSAGSSLTLNKDSSFSMGYGPSVYSGTWKLTNNTVQLEVKEINGLNMEQLAKASQRRTDDAPKRDTNWSLELSSDAKHLSGSDPNDPGTVFAFTLAQ